MITVDFRSLGCVSDERPLSRISAGVRAFNSRPATVEALRKLRRVLPGDPGFGDPLSTAGRDSAAAIARLATEGKIAVRYYPDAHPVVTEVVATQRAVAIAETTGAPIYIVHLSSADALDTIRRAVSAGTTTPAAAAGRLLGYLDQNRAHD